MKETQENTTPKRSSRLSSAITIRIVAVALAVIAVAAVVWWIGRGVRESEIYVGSDEHINVTPEKITEIKNIGQWEFLSVVDEQVIDTVRHNLLKADDRLTCIYHGTLRLGIDLSLVPADWAVSRGDTVYVTLPAPRLLDNRFIDEARTRVFYERGRWSAAAREQMYRRASKQMKAYALTPENLQSVRTAAHRRFEDLFLALGAKAVVVDIDTDDLSDFN